MKQPGSPSWVGNRQRGRRLAQLLAGNADQVAVPLQHWDGLVAAPGAGHRAGSVELSEELAASVQLADRAVADARPLAPALDAREVVVERDRPVEIRERDPETLRDDLQRVVREIPVTIVKGMQEREEGRRLLAPLLDEVLVGGHGGEKVPHRAGSSQGAARWSGASLVLHRAARPRLCMGPCSERLNSVPTGMGREGGEACRLSRLEHVLVNNPG